MAINMKHIAEQVWKTGARFAQFLRNSKKIKLLNQFIITTAALDAVLHDQRLRYRKKKKKPS